MLQKQPLSLPLSEGIDTKSDPKQVAPGKLLRLENGFFQSPGEIRKRYGYTALPGGLSTGAVVSTYQNQLILGDGQNVYSYSSAASGYGGSYGNFFNVHVTHDTVYRSTVTEECPDVAYHSGKNLYCYGWNENTGAVGTKLLVRDGTTGAIIGSVKSLESSPGVPLGVGVQVRAIGNYFVAIFAINNSGCLGWSYLDLNNLGAGWSAYAFLPHTGVPTAGNPPFDAVVIGTKIYVAFYDTSTNIGLFTIDSALTVSGLTNTAAAGGAHGVAVWTDNTSLWIAYAAVSGGGSVVKAMIYNQALAQTLAPTTIDTTATALAHLSGIYVSAGQSAIYYDPQVSTTYNRKIYGNTLTSGGAVGSPTIMVRSLSLQAKPFSEGGNIYFIGCYTASDQFTYFLLQSSGVGAGSQATCPIVAKIAQGAAHALPLTAPFTVPSVINPSSHVWLFPSSQVDSRSIVGVDVVTLTFSGYVPHEDLAYNLHLGSGFVGMFDGLSAVEHGFHVYPESPTLVAASPGGSIAAGTYDYLVVYAWTDNQGQVHRSAPSVATQVVVAAGSSQVTVTCPTLRVTAKTTVVLEVYRTQSLGTVYYLLGTAANSTTADTVDYVDTVADATIASNAQLYTTGGAVDNISAPAVLDMCVYRNRIIVIPSESPKSWWYSKQVEQGGPVEFSDLFTNNIDGYGGDLTAVATLDDKLILFKENSIFVVTGNGPTPNGLNDDYSQPQFITTDVGAVSAASVVSMPNGLMFQSRKGICLLDRSLTVQPIGLPIEEFNPPENQPTIYNATLYPAFSQVRFLNSTGNAFVYDYLLNQWYLYTNHAGYSACVFGDRYVYLKTNGSGYLESTSVFTDAGSFVQLLLQTSWLQFAQVQGFQRVYYIAILGEYESAHNLVAQVSYDFQSSVSQTTTITPTSTQPYEWRLFLQKQKCTAIQLTLNDSQSLPYGEGLRISDITLLVGVKGGINRLAASRSFA